MSTERELVDQVFACPVCHNNVMDNLICRESDNVKCTRCNTEYNPQTMKYKRYYVFKLLRKTVKVTVEQK